MMILIVPNYFSSFLTPKAPCIRYRELFRAGVFGYYVVFSSSRSSFKVYYIRLSDKTKNSRKRLFFGSNL